MTDLTPHTRRTLLKSFADLAPNVHWARRMHRTIPESFERRIYDFELLLVQKGELHATIEEESFILNVGDLLYIPSWTVHRISFDEEVSLIGIHFDFFGEMVLSADDDDIVIYPTHPPKLNHCLEPELPEHGLLVTNKVLTAPPQIIPMIERIVEEFSSKKHGHELACRGLMLQVLYHLLQRNYETQKQIHPRYGQGIMNLTKRMESEYAEDWSYTRVALELNLQKDYAAKLFKETIGLTPIKFVQKIRQQEAKRLLRETNDSLADIAQRIGYDDPHYFSRIFNKLEGISPGSYRKLTKIL